MTVELLRALLKKQQQQFDYCSILKKIYISHKRLTKISLFFYAFLRCLFNSLVGFLSLIFITTQQRTENYKQMGARDYWQQHLGSFGRCHSFNLFLYRFSITPRRPVQSSPAAKGKEEIHKLRHFDVVYRRDLAGRPL